MQPQLMKVHITCQPSFKQCHPSYANTKVVIIDKDFTELAVLREELLSKTIPAVLSIPCHQMFISSCP